MKQLFGLVSGFLVASVLAFEAQASVIRLDFEAQVVRTTGIFAEEAAASGVDRVTGSLYIDTGFRDVGASSGNPGNLNVGSRSFPALNAVWGVDIRFGSVERTTRTNDKTTQNTHHILYLDDNTSILPGGADQLYYGAQRNMPSDHIALVSIIAPGMISDGQEGAGDVITLALLERIALNFNTTGPDLSVSAISEFDAFASDGSLEGFVTFRIDRLTVVDLGGTDPAVVPLPATLPLILLALGGMGYAARRHA